MQLTKTLELARQIHRALPRSIRQPVRQMLDYFVVLSTPPSTRVPTGSPTVVGLLSSSAGLGEAARRTLAALQQLGYSPGGIDLSATFGHDSNPVLAPDVPSSCEINGGSALIVQVNAPDVAPALLCTRKSRSVSQYRVGYWVWELARAPKSWKRTAGLFSEIWAPSRFAQAALEAAGIRNVRVVPHPFAGEISVSVDSPIKMRGDAFHLLSVFDLRSSIDRKNPFANIEAFENSVLGREDGVLWIKVSGGKERPHDYEALQRRCGNKPNIRLVDELFSAHQMRALMAGADAFISLHRAEGFGLLLAEACLLGTPAVATAWSGNMDFMDHPDACLVSHDLVPVRDRSGRYPGDLGEWAEPQIDSAITWLDKLYLDTGFRRRTSVAMCKHVGERLSLRRFGDIIKKSIGGPAASAETWP